MLVDSVANLQLFEHARDQTEVIENLAFWKLSFAEISQLDFL